MFHNYLRSKKLDNHLGPFMGTEERPQLKAEAEKG